MLTSLDRRHPQASRVQPVRQHDGKSSRVAELDGVRGCAIILILLWHYVWAQLAFLEPRTGAAYIRVLTSLTWSGVDLFFVLSGFLIAGILMDNRDSSNYFRVFYARRICRIFPLYFLLLGLFAILVVCGASDNPRFAWLFHNPFSMWTYATFTQNIPMGLYRSTGANWLGITWSLAVEEQFYLFIPILIRIFSRRAFVVITVALIFLAPILRGVRNDSFLPLWRGDSLLTGAILAVFVRSPSFMNWAKFNTTYLYSAFFGLLGGAALLTFKPGVFGIANHTWLALLFATVILIALAGPQTILARALRNRVLVWFGTISYGLYMYHQAISGLVHGTWGSGEPSLGTSNGAVLTAVAFVLSLVVAAISYHFFEKPILRFGQIVNYQRSGASFGGAWERAPTESGKCPRQDSNLRPPV